MTTKNSKLPTLLLPGNIIIKKSFPDYVKAMTGIEFVSNIVNKSLTNKNPKSIGEKVIILKSGTGSGKSVTVAPFNMKLLKVTNKAVLIQPRVLTTISITNDIIKYNKGFKLGENIGYITGSLKKKTRSGLTVMTYGILLNQMLNSDLSKFANKYKIIFLDEIHERQEDTDIIIYFLKKMLLENYKIGNVPTIVIMSATFNPQVYINYFDVPEDNFIEIKGRSNPINSNFPKISPINLDQYVIDTVKNIHINNIKDVAGDLRDIVIFVEGGSRATTYINEIHKLNAKLFDKPWSEISGKKNDEIDDTKKYYLSPVLVTSGVNQVGGKDYTKIFSDIDSYDEYLYKIVNKNKKESIDIKNFTTINASRKVYIGTNVMETGVTIDKLKYCIDTGYQIKSYFDPNLSSNLLITSNISQDNALQRKGRVGRLGPGEWYPAYTEDIYNKFTPTKLPDVLTNESSMFWLRLLILSSKLTLNPSIPSDDDKLKKEMGLIFNKHILEDPIMYELIQKNKINISNIDLLSIPSMSSIKYALEKLHGLGFINYDYIISPLAYFIRNIKKISIESLRMLLSAYYYDCNIMQIITIIASIEILGKSSLFVGRKSIVYQNPLNLETNKKNFVNKYVIKDDLINYLFVWDSLEDEIKKNILINKKYNLIGIIKQWCKINSVKFSVLLRLITFRTEIIERLISNGINPYYNGTNINIHEMSLTNLLNTDYEQGIKEIKKIKQCLYDGFRFNLLKLNRTGKSYSFVHKQRQAFLISDLTFDSVDVKPQYLITPDLILTNMRSKDGIYRYLCERVSVLDDYIDVDNNYLLY